MSARGAANALTKLTWIFAAGFIVTSISLTVIAARNAAGSSVVDGATTEAPASAPATTVPAPEGNLLPPPSGDAPVTPTAPATTAPATTTAPAASN